MPPAGTRQSVGGLRLRLRASELRASNLRRRLALGIVRLIHAARAAIAEQKATTASAVYCSLPGRCDGVCMRSCPAAARATASRCQARLHAPSGRHEAGRCSEHASGLGIWQVAVLL